MIVVGGAQINIKERLTLTAGTFFIIFQSSFSISVSQELICYFFKVRTITRLEVMHHHV